MRPMQVSPLDRIRSWIAGPSAETGQVNGVGCRTGPSIGPVLRQCGPAFVSSPAATFVPASALHVNESRINNFTSSCPARRSVGFWRLCDWTSKRIGRTGRRKDVALFCTQAALPPSVMPRIVNFVIHKIANQQIVYFFYLPLR